RRRRPRADGPGPPQRSPQPRPAPPGRTRPSGAPARSHASREHTEPRPSSLPAGERDLDPGRPAGERRPPHRRVAVDLPQLPVELAEVGGPHIRRLTVRPDRPIGRESRADTLAGASLEVGRRGPGPADPRRDRAAVHLESGRLTVDRVAVAVPPLRPDDHERDPDRRRDHHRSTSCTLDGRSTGRVSIGPRVVDSTVTPMSPAARRSRSRSHRVSHAPGTAEVPCDTLNGPTVSCATPAGFRISLAAAEAQ